MAMLATCDTELIYKKSKKKLNPKTKNPKPYYLTPKPCTL
jgi:hypothetical protein